MTPVRLREWRQFRNLSQEALAAHSGVARATIERLEKLAGVHSARPGTPLELMGYPEEYLAIAAEWAKPAE